jgi:hypothetical protein
MTGHYEVHNQTLAHRDLRGGIRTIVALEMSRRREWATFRGLARDCCHEQPSKAVRVICLTGQWVNARPFNCTSVEKVNVPSFLLP